MESYKEYVYDDFIVFENDEVIIVDKPFGILSQSSGKDSRNTIEQLIREKRGEDTVLYPVNRLDRVTGGLMILAKTEKAAASLSELIRSGAVRKEYLAVAKGKPDPAEGELTDYLFYDRGKDKSFIVKKGKDRKGVKKAELSYILLKSIQTDNGEISLVKIKLGTGRTHQIRVQFANIGCPLLGDGKYGGGDNRAKDFLLSHSLIFDGFCVGPDGKISGKSGEKLIFEAQIPEKYPWSMFETE